MDKPYRRTLEEITESLDLNAAMDRALEYADDGPHGKTPNTSVRTIYVLAELERQGYQVTKIAAGSIFTEGEIAVLEAATKGE